MLVSTELKVKRVDIWVDYRHNRICGLNENYCKILTAVGYFVPAES